MVAVPLHECNGFCQVVQDAGYQCKSARVLGTLTPVFLWCTADTVQSVASSERDLIHKVTVVEYHVTFFGAFIRSVRYCTTKCPAYSWKFSVCVGGAALFYVPMGPFKSQPAFGIFCLVRNMVVNPMLA